MVDDSSCAHGPEGQAKSYGVAKNVLRPARSVNRICRGFAGHPEVAEAMSTIETLLAPRGGIGRLRLLEYQGLNIASTPPVDPDLLVDELKRLLTPTVR